MSTSKDLAKIFEELEHCNIQSSFDSQKVAEGYLWIFNHPSYEYIVSLDEQVRNKHLCQLGTCVSYMTHNDYQVRQESAYKLHLILAEMIKGNELKLKFDLGNSFKELQILGSPSKESKNYYGVAIGRNGPKIYNTWEECEQDVKGHSNAKFKKFPTYEQAYDYISQYL